MSDAPGPVVYPRIEAYGDGGFRIDGERVEGSVFVLAGAIRPWRVGALADLGPQDFDPVFALAPPPAFVLFGVGARTALPPAAVAARFREAAIGLEFMSTGAACRVYATLASEGRPFAAALIAV